MYELLTGEKPFRGTLETIAYKICHEEPPAPSTLVEAQAARGRRPLVATALAKAPEARFQSAKEFRKALDDVAKLSVEVDEGLGTTVVNIGTLMLAKPAPLGRRDAAHGRARARARAGTDGKVIVRRAPRRRSIARSCARSFRHASPTRSRGAASCRAFNKAGGGQSRPARRACAAPAGATRARPPRERRPARSRCRWKPRTSST
jgi:hypothetical protein